MKVLALASLMMLQTAAPEELPSVDDDYSAVERHLDDALEHMIAAQTYICDDLRGPPGATAPRRRYDALDQRFMQAVATAEGQLERRLNLRIWTNSCRLRDPGREFRQHLQSASEAIEAAERLLQQGASI